MTALAAALDEMAFNARTFAREIGIVLLLVLVCSIATLASFSIITTRTTGSSSAAATATSPPSTAAPMLPSHGVTYLTSVDGEPAFKECGVPVVLLYDAQGAPYDATEVLQEASQLFATAAAVPVRVNLGPVDWNAPAQEGPNLVTISWTGSLGTDGPRTEVLGEGAPTVDSSHLDGGHVALAADTAWPAAGAEPGSEVVVLLHELGHTAGLDHDADGQMTATASHTRPPGFSTDEAAALRWIFTSDCFNS